LDVASIIIIFLVWYAIQGLPLVGAKLFGSYTFGKLYWLLVLALVGIVLFDIGERATPLAASAIRRYTEKRVASSYAWAITSIGVLIAVWLILATPFETLAKALEPSISSSALLVLYHVLFGIAVAYYAVSGVIRSKAARFQQPEALRQVSWDGLEESVRISGYLKRLEALKSSGNIDDRTYEKLRMEYETRLREAIELP
jgi:hypothetical protein